MSGTKKRSTGKRWVCPVCGAGVLAPSQPRLDDVRRYCFPCSTKSGRLVKRTCPALDRERAEKKQRSAAKTLTKRQRERELELAQRTAAGVDLLAEAKRLWRLPTLREDHEPLRRNFPTIEFRRHRQGWKFFSSGHCYYSGSTPRVIVTIGLDGYGAWETLLHELVHASLPYDVHHSDRFWRLLRQGARQAWPEVAFRWSEAPTRGHALDNWIGERLAEHYKEAA